MYKINELLTDSEGNTVKIIDRAQHDGINIYATVRSNDNVTDFSEVTVYSEQELLQNHKQESLQNNDNVNDASIGGYLNDLIVVLIVLICTISCMGICVTVIQLLHQMVISII